MASRLADSDSQLCVLEVTAQKLVLREMKSAINIYPMNKSHGLAKKIHICKTFFLLFRRFWVKEAAPSFRKKNEKKCCLLS